MITRILKGVLIAALLVRILKVLLVAALLASFSARAANDTIHIAMEDGRTRAEFKMSDSRCVLADDQIRCTPVKQ